MSDKETKQRDPIQVLIKLAVIVIILVVLFTRLQS